MRTNGAGRRRWNPAHRSPVQTPTQSPTEIESPPPPSRAGPLYGRMQIFPYDTVARRCAPVDVNAFPGCLRCPKGHSPEPRAATARGNSRCHKLVYIQLRDPPVSGGVDPRINGEQRVAGTTRCRAGRQDAASRQAASRLLRCAPALRVTRRNVLTHRVFMAGSELPATSRPICENTSSPEVNPHILCSPFIRGFSQPPTPPLVLTRARYRAASRWPYSLSRTPGRHVFSLGLLRKQVHAPFPTCGFRMRKRCVILAEGAGVPPKLIIFNGFLVGARAQHCQGQRRQRDRFATTETIPTRNGDFGATRAGSEWPARRAHSTACPNA